MSPDGQTICSGAADETLRLWECFAVDPSQQKKYSKTSRGSSSSTGRKMNSLFSIRWWEFYCNLAVFTLKQGCYRISCNCEERNWNFFVFIRLNGTSGIFFSSFNLFICSAMFFKDNVSSHESPFVGTWRIGIFGCLIELKVCLTFLTSRCFTSRHFCFLVKRFCTNTCAFCGKTEKVENMFDWPAADVVALL